MIWKILALAKSPWQYYFHSLAWLKPEIVSSVTETAWQLTLAIFAGLVFNWLHIPVGWLLGPMMVGIAYAISQGKSQPLPASLALAGQAIVAIATAARFSLDTLTEAANYAFPLLFCILITGSISLGNGYLLSRWAGIDRATGFLGCIPGAGPSIVAMSEEMGADAIAVAVLQYLRILLVALIVPSLASFLFPLESIEPAVAAITSTNHQLLPLSLNLPILAACGAIGIWVGTWLRLPSSMFLGPFLVGLLTFWTLPQQLQVPPIVFSGGLLLVGLSIGLKFDWQTARKLLKAVLLEVVLLMLLILICLGVGYEFHAIAHVDTVTAILGSTPGGITAMIATVIQLGGDSGLVMAMQMTRMLLILLLSPWFAASLIKGTGSSANL